MLLPPDKQKTLDKILIDLKEIENIQAIVLGGSYATGRVSSNSDLDIGLYYHENNPFSIAEIQKIAEKHAINQSPSVTEFYQLGPWVNGGAWIQTESGKVDFLYRNINQVRHTIKDALDGIWENHFSNNLLMASHLLFTWPKLNHASLSMIHKI